MQTESLVSSWDVGFDLLRLYGFTTNSGQLIIRQFSCLMALSLLIFCLVSTKMVVLAVGHS